MIPPTELESAGERLLASPTTRWFAQPFLRFARLESASSLLLLGAALLAFGAANSELAGPYARLLELPVSFGVGRPEPWPLLRWVNDVLMAFFFLLVGLEVKREVLVGELASVRRATLPVAAAAGGMLCPALLYLSLNHSGVAARGWGVPIATDIAFSLAILTAFGSRVPLALRVFLASLAIADDIGGVVVIAVAYTRSLHWAWLGGALLAFAVCLAVSRLGVTRLSIYMAFGCVFWMALYKSGVHPTLAGVLLALAIPSRELLPAETFVQHVRVRLEAFAKARRRANKTEQSHEHLLSLKRGIHLVESPLDRLETALHGWVSYGIMPLFALFNAGVSVRGFHAGSLVEPTFAGVVLGLVIGKPLGITVFSWAAVRTGLAERPRGVSWAQLHAAAWVAGIGFTVAIFVAGLAFGEGALYAQTRIAILLASVLAAAAGAMLLGLATRGRAKAKA